MTLRPLLRTDALRLQEIGTDVVFRQIPEIPTPFDAIAWVETKFESAVPEIAHVVIENCSGDIIGYCQVAIGIGDKSYYLDLGYWFGESYWRKGYASESVREVLKYMKSNNWTRYPTLAKASSDNLASRRVLEKCNFILLEPKPSFLKDEGMLMYEWRNER
ncbi:MAG: GNAT family N-acetyltransferase [Gammaproteobacteria bacterium]